MIKPEQIPDEVVEAAHRAALEADFNMRDQLRAAIAAMRPFIRAEALEEAAKVAKAYEHPNMALYNHQTGIAAAIRALKEKP